MTKKKEALEYLHHESPHGSYTALWADNALIFLGLTDASLPELQKRWPKARPTGDSQSRHQEILSLLKKGSYGVESVPHGTPFQQRVWEALLTIPFGTTLSYKALASRIGHPRAVRAVANAVGRNPLAILIPCHRVIKSDGSLCGYHWGIETKKALLAYELRNA